MGLLKTTPYKKKMRIRTKECFNAITRTKFFIVADMMNLKIGFFCVELALLKIKYQYVNTYQYGGT